MVDDVDAILTRIAEADHDELLLNQTRAEMAYAEAKETNDPSAPDPHGAFQEAKDRLIEHRQVLRIHEGRVTMGIVITDNQEG